MKGVLLMSNNESIKAIFKDNLNKLLIEKDVTQKALADFVGVSTATVSDWKKGKKMPLMEKVDKICQFFHVDRSKLVGNTLETGSDYILESMYTNAGKSHFFLPPLDPVKRQSETPIDNAQKIKLETLLQELKHIQQALAAVANEQERPTITEAEQALLDAYRNAPADKKTIVNLTLGLHAQIKKATSGEGDSF
jgi:transcriptional regulator with XRE-family HTH domain